MSIPSIRIILCLALFGSTVSAQTTITYAPAENNSNSYESTADNPLTLSVLSGSAVQSGIVSGDGQVTKTGSGDLTLSAGNNYTGDTFVTGGTLNVTGAVSDSHRIYVGQSSDAVLSVSSGGQVTPTSFIQLGGGSGFTGTFNVSGSGSQAAAGWYIDVGFDGTGAVSIIDGGSVSSASFFRIGVNSTGVGTVFVGGTGSTLNVGSQLEVGTYGQGTLTVEDGGVVTAEALHFNRLGTGHGTLHLNSGGTFVITSGAGISHFASLSSASLNLSGGTLQAGASFSSSVGATLTNASTIDTGNHNVTFSQVLEGDGSLTKSGGGTLTLSADNTYTGTTTISAGTLQLGVGATTGSIASGTIINHGNLAINRSDDTTLAAEILGSGSLTKQGSGALTASGDYTFSQVAIQGGSLILPSESTIEFGGGNSLTAAGGGSLVLSGGTFRLGGDDFSMFVPAVLTGNTTFATNGYSGGIYGALSGTGGYTKVGAGVLSVTSANTFSGPVIVEGGTLVVNTATDLGTGNGSVTVNVGAALAAASHLEFARDVTATGVDAVVVSPNHLEVGSAGDGTMTISNGGLVGSGTTTTLAYFGGDTGTIEVSGTDSMLYAQIALRVGFGGTGTLTIADGGTANAQSLILGAQAGGVGTLNLNSGGTLMVGGADGITIGAGTGTFNLAGGTLRVGGDERVVAPPSADSFDLTNLAAGMRSVINANTPQSGDAGLTTSVPMTLTHASTIDTGDSAANLAGVLSGGGSLTKVGAGTLTLSGANTYTGATMVSAGTLALGEGGAIESPLILLAGGTVFDVSATSFSLAPGQTLAGSGSIDGLVAVGSGGILDPGAIAGTLTFNDGLTLEGGAILSFGLGTSSDLIAIMGGILTGPMSGMVTLNITDAGGFAEGTYTLIDYTAADGTAHLDVHGFAIGSAIAGFSYSISLDGGMLQLTAVPEPATCAIILGLGALVFACRHRR